jgi:hypothetical protein
VSLQQALWLALSFAAGSIIIFGLFFSWLRVAGRAALITTVFVLGFFTYAPLVQGFHADPKTSGGALVLYLLGLSAAMVYAGWKRPSYDGATRFLNIVSLVLILQPIVSLSLSAYRGSGAHSTALNTTEATPERRPDIFYIILDGHGRADAIRSTIGYSESWFVGALRKQGFFVGSKSTSNYVQTELSLASSLNGIYLQSLDLPEQSDNAYRQKLDELIANSEIARYLKQRGYGYLAIRTGFPFTTFSTADLVYGESPNSELLLVTLLDLTPLGRLHLGSGSLYETKRKLIKEALSDLTTIAETHRRPFFAVAHIMAPHPPFVFGSKGEPLDPPRPFTFSDGSDYEESGGTREEYRRGYAGQLEYIDRELLSACSSIRRNDPDAIIILQGDHGPKSELDQESLAKTNLNEVAPILMAISAPSTKLDPPNNLTPVNLFRVLKSGVFLDPQPLLPNKIYYSPWKKPFDLVDVTSKITGSPR